MQADGFNLDAYLARIGYAGPRDASVETLRAIHRAQATRIPFENLVALLRRHVPLDPPSRNGKLVGAMRGGYCFEHNALLTEALCALGFKVTGLIARVRWMAAPEDATPRTHMVLRVETGEGPYIADTGFGAVTLPVPLRFVGDEVQETPLEPFRLATRGDGYEMQALLGEDWAPLYRFTMEPQAPVDYEAANWYTSTHPQSLFTNHLVVCRPDEGVRYALMNDRLTVRPLGGEPETRQLGDVEELVSVLRDLLLVEVSAEDRAALGEWMKLWKASGAGEVEASGDVVRSRVEPPFAGDGGR